MDFNFIMFHLNGNIQILKKKTYGPQNQLNQTDVRHFSRFTPELSRVSRCTLKCRLVNGAFRRNQLYWNFSSFDKRSSDFCNQLITVNRVLIWVALKTRHCLMLRSDRICPTWFGFSALSYWMITSGWSSGVVIGRMGHTDVRKWVTEFFQYLAGSL